MTDTGFPNRKRIGLISSPIRFLLIISCAVVAFTSCIPTEGGNQSITHGWVLSDLVWLGEGSSASEESQLIAAYFRQTGQESQIRLDLLDMTGFFKAEIQVLLDTSPGGSWVLPGCGSAQVEWDFYFSLKMGSPPEVHIAASGLTTRIIPRMVQDTRLDTMVIAWNRNLISSSILNNQFQVILLDPASRRIISQTPVIRAGNDPPKQAPLLLAFWNSLPAATPAQALRRWEGAHTGPLGQRHGLNVVTTLARNYKIPVALLDLRLPESLAALDYMAVSTRLQSSLSSGQLLVPQLAWGDPSWSNQSLALSSSFSRSLGWSQSPVACGAFPDPLPGDFSYFFARIPNPGSIQEYRGARLIPLPGSNYGGNQDIKDQIGTDGLSKSVKVALLEAALSSDQTDLVVLGGDLPQSLWAEESIAPLAFEYIAEHPWIAPLSPSELLEFPAQLTETWPLPGCEDLLCSNSTENIPLMTSNGERVASRYTRQTLLNSLTLVLADLPGNIYAKSAVNSFLMLSADHPDPHLDKLRTNYLNQVGYLAYAAAWASQPRVVSTCQLDVDWDGEAECILASDEILVIVELDGGRIVLAGSKDNLWIAPSSLFSVGTGDPGSWRLDLGPASDPQVIPGALADNKSPFSPFNAQIEPGGLILSRVGSSEVKSLSISEQKLQIIITGIKDYETRIPLIINASAYKPSEWSEQLTISCDEKQCGLPYGDHFLNISPQNVVFETISSLDSHAYMQSAELPDRDYPEGHFLPFPLAVINLNSYPDVQSFSIMFENK